MSPSPDISKWYMDCVSEAGDVLVGYSTLIKWRNLTKGVSSTLEHTEATGSRTRVSMRGFQPPELDENTLRWRSRPLGVDGEWVADEAPVKKRLLDADEGFIDWSCYQPRARVRIARSDSRQVIEGLGYVEHLRMTVRPWELPIEELRWGRFVAAGQSLVWIEWRGPRPLTVAFRNGLPVEVSAVSDKELALEDGVRLQLEDRLVLREGPLVSTVFSETPLLRSLLPDKMLKTYECKWRSRGRLSCPRQEESRGWVIHEVVRWE